MLDQRVSLITLGVADLARARAFHTGLGWREAPASQEGIVFFQLPGQVLALYPRAAILGVILPILVGGNLIWAAAAARAGRVLTSARAVRGVNRVSGGILAAAGVAIAAR